MLFCPKPIPALFVPTIKANHYHIFSNRPEFVTSRKSNKVKTKLLLTKSKIASEPKA
tara:strand:- start:472 stop:642 length:171 start_codon:yes stop_codon:yes gene_type:complete